MRRIVLLLSSLLVCVGTACAQEQAAVPGITTSGRAVVTVPPDSLRLVFHLAAEAAAYQLAREELDRAEQGLRQALDGLGIEGLQVTAAPIVPSHRPWQSSGFGGYGAGYGGPPAETDKPKGNWASRQMAVSVAGPEGDALSDYAERIWQVAQDHGVEGPDRPAFFATPEAQAKGERQALQAAVQNAIANAEAVAKAAGVLIKGYERISGTPMSYYRDQAFPAGAGGTGPAWITGAAEVFPGTLVVTCTVTVTAVY